MMKSLHVCTSCGQKFKTNEAFNAHACVKALEDKGLDELMKMYQAQQARPKTSTARN